MTSEPSQLSDMLRTRAFDIADRFVDEPLVRTLDPIEYDRDEFADVIAEGAGMLDAMREARWTARMPSKFSWAKLDDLDSLDAAQRAPLLDWAAAPAGRNLNLFGPVGVGKSHAAIACCRPSFDRGLDVEYVAATSMLEGLRPGGDLEIADLVGVDLLIIDDLGSERQTEWSIEQLYAVIDGRWREERALIVTTNLSTDALEDRIGERMFSRLVGSGATNVRLSGDDRRRKR